LNKFYKRLLLAFVSITFGYSFIFLGFYLYNSNNHEKKILNHKNEVFISQIKTSIDSKFIMAKNVISFLRHSEYLKSYGESVDINYYASYKLKETLTQSQASFSELGYIISILKKDSDMVITPYGTRDLKSFILENGIPLSYEKTIRESFNTEKELQVIEGYLSKKIETSDNPFMGKSITFTEHVKDREMDFIFFVTFYEDSLLPKNITNMNESFILFQGRRVLLSRSKIDSYLVKDALFDSENIKEYKVYKINSGVIPHGGFMLITPKKNLGNITNNEILKSLFLYLFLIIISAVISILYTQNNYKPINKVLYSLDWKGNDRDEFKFIQDTTRKIKDANEKLTKSIMLERIPLQVKFLRDCLNGLLRNDEISKNIHKYNMNISTDKISVVIIQFNDDELMDNFSNEIVLQIREKVSFIIRENLKLMCNFELVEINYLITATIIYDMDQKDIRENFTKILTDLSSLEELDITVSIGTTVNSFIDIKKSYFSAMSEIDKWDGTSKHLLPMIDNETDVKSQSFFFPLETERRIIKYITSGKEEGITLIQSILERNKDSLHLNNEEWDSFIRAIIRTIKRILNQINKPESVIIDENLSIREYIISDSRITVVKNIITLYKRLLDVIQQTSSGEQRSFADKLLKYINENYSDPNLSLIDIADYFNLSPAYISRIFKDYTGKNFKDLLSFERIKISQNILQNNPNIKVYVLGSQVGFNSTNTFLRTFKKYAGISPGKYADNILDNE